MANQLYVVNLSGYDTAYKWIFYGPDIGGKEQWKAFVDSFFPEAARHAMAEEIDDDGMKSFVGSSDIMKHVLERLRDHGYVQLTPISAGYGEVIIYNQSERGRLPLGDEEDAVIAHNKEVDDRLTQDYEERKKQEQ